MNPLDAQNNPSVQDAETLLKTMDVEIAMRRAKRLQNEEQRKTTRTLYAILVVLLLAVMMVSLWYLQAKRARHGVTRRPAPAASAPAVR